MQAEKRIVERRRYTVEEYHEMDEAGMFGEDEHRGIEGARRSEELASEALPGLLVPVNDSLRG